MLYVSMQLRGCSSHALSHLRALFRVGAWCSDPGPHVLSLGFVSGIGQSRFTFCLFVGVCSLEFAQPRALLSPCIVFPSGNIELRRDARGNAISVVQLWIICVISQNWRPDVRCGDVMTRMLKSTWCAAGASFLSFSKALCVCQSNVFCESVTIKIGNKKVYS